MRQIVQMSNKSDVQLTRYGLKVSEPAQTIARLRLDFRRKHYFKLKHFLESGLLRTIHQRVEQAEFFEKTDQDIAMELRMNDAATMGILLFLMNNAELLSFIEQVTGCGKIGCFGGRVYKFEPSANHSDSWHDDKAGERRLVGISINLSSQAYSGGILQMRAKKSGKTLCNISNSEFGDAIVFRLSKQIEHRVTAVSGSARTAIAGWFQTDPEFHALFHQSKSLRNHVASDTQQA